jgi:3-hydroxyisobutyrate dehydrogenase
MNALPEPFDLRVGWVGLGRMGSAMVARLLESGVQVAVWNRTLARTTPLVEQGAGLLPNLPAAASCDVIFSMVTDDAAIDALTEVDGGLFSGLADSRSAKVWIDGSTVSPAAAQRAARAAAAAGVAYVSAPISGNPGVVSSGNAIFAISGDESGLDIAEALVLRIGRKVFRVGSSAEANVVKLCTNALLAVTMQSLAEIAVLADKAGVSRGALMAFLNESAVGSAFTGYKTQNILSLEFPPTTTVEGQRKDIRLALDLARTYETPMPVLSSTEVEFSRLFSGGLGNDRDYAALILDVARDAGHTLIPELEQA